MVGLGVRGGLGQQHGVLLGGHTQLIVEGAVPDLLHIVPVGDNAMLNGVLEGQDAPLALVLVAHTHQHTWVSGLPDDGCPGGIIPSKARLAHVGARVNVESGDLLFHCGGWRWTGVAAPWGNTKHRARETALFSFLTRE